MDKKERRELQKDWLLVALAAMLGFLVNIAASATYDLYTSGFGWRKLVFLFPTAISSIFIVGFFMYVFENMDELKNKKNTLWSLVWKYIKSLFRKGNESNLLEVPYVQQFNTNTCGAAVLEMIYKYNGLKNISQQELMVKYQELEPHGSGNYRMTTDSLITDARARGFNAGWIRVNWESIKDSISLIKVFMDFGIPVIVCQKFTNELPSIGHFRIVLGIQGEIIYLHDPNIETGGANLEWPISKFMEFWKPTGDNVTGGILCFINK